MFWEIDSWREIGESMLRHKLRTVLTAFGIFYGVFILVMLMAFSIGFERGVMKLFERANMNSIFIGAGRTSQPYEGLPSGRFIQFTEEDLRNVSRLDPKIENLTPRKSLGGSNQVTYGNRSGNFPSIGVFPGYANIDRITLEKGRLINQFDIHEARRVAVVGKLVSDVIFREEPEPLGKFILIGEVSFTVIGIFTAEGDDNDMRQIFIPYQTLERTFHPGEGFEFMTFSLQTREWSRLEEDLRDYFARKYRFSRDDPSAIFIFNLAEEFARVQMLFKGIHTFTLFVGLSTLVAGVIGVSNIMLVTVKERTREIGIRKALGATPARILLMILHESVVVTVASGYFGLLSGVILTEAFRKSEFAGDFFFNPQVDMSLATLALGILVFSGLLAGFLPARHAAHINPIEALRYE